MLSSGQMARGASLGQRLIHNLRRSSQRGIGVFSVGATSWLRRDRDQEVPPTDLVNSYKRSRRLLVLVIRICFEFRASDFGFAAPPRVAAKLQPKNLTLHIFPYNGIALSPPYTHGCKTVPRIHILFEKIHQESDQPRTRSGQGMPVCQ